MFLKRLGIVLAALIPVATVGAFVFQSSDDQTVTTTPTSSTTTPTTGSTTTTPAASGTTAVTSDVATDTPTTTSSTYEDGTYTAEGPYTSPAGSENITVTLTLASDVVVDMSVVTHGVGPSALWQGKFSSGIEAAVIGKNIDDLNLTNVSGSSLTPIGFGAAVESIKAQAEA